MLDFALVFKNYDCSRRPVTKGMSSEIRSWSWIHTKTCLALRILVFILLLSSCHAHSLADDSSLEQVELLEDPLILTQWHRISASSRFDMILWTKNLDNSSSSSQEAVYKFELEPNTDFHQPSSFDRLLANGQMESVPINSASRPLVFKGRSLKRVARTGATNQHRQALILQNENQPRLQSVPWEYSPVGWVRIVITKDGPAPLFQGAWQSDDGIYHAKIDSTDTKTPRVTINREPISMGLKKRDQIVEPEWNLLDEMTLNHVPPISRVHRRAITGSFVGTGLDLYSSLGSNQGCPEIRKIALIGVAVDCAMTASFPDEDAVREYVISNVNLASEIFEKSFNISLGLKALVISDRTCPPKPNEAAPWNSDCRSDSSYKISDHLSSFSKWRSSKGNDEIAVWQLMTGCRSGPAVGLAWLGTLCMNQLREQENAFISGASVVAKVPRQWKVMAHEMAHNFGAVHDCTSDACMKHLNKEAQCCPNSKHSCSANEAFLMNPATSELATDFSPCTVGNVCSGLKAKTVDSSCLVSNTGMQLVTDSVCGNGIVEEGEECDCGGEEGCKDNKCCDPKTCKLTVGSVCDDSTMRCCKECQFAPASTVCRPAAGICDLEEQCTGTSAECPQDRVAEDGMDCGDGKKCASGICTSRDDQCSKLIKMAFNATGGKACADATCQMSCINPQMNKNMCLNFDQIVLDGTPCGNDDSGKCRHGVCLGEDTRQVNGLIQDIEKWIKTHRGIFIATMAAGGTLILAALGLSIYRCITRIPSPPSDSAKPKPQYWITTCPTSSNTSPQSQSTLVGILPNGRPETYNNGIYGAQNPPNI